MRWTVVDERTARRLEIDGRRPAVLAISTMAIEFMAMAQDLELVARRNLVLGPLDHLALEFLDPPAFDADEMVVVLLFDFVARDTVVESMFGR